VNLFRSAESSDPFTRGQRTSTAPWVFNMCGACAVTVSGWRSVRVEYVEPVRVDGQPHAFAHG
jgi:hypothetical protein